LGDIFADLLTFAANSLVEGGRLVFWIPVNREHYSEEKLPTHPNLKMVANCEQWLSSHTSRRCLVLEKVKSEVDYTNLCFLTFAVNFECLLHSIMHYGHKNGKKYPFYEFCWSASKFPSMFPTLQFKLY
jgi:hypothetical protein